MNNRLFDASFNRLNLHILESGLYCGDSGWIHKDIVSPFNRIYWMMEGQGVLEFGGQSLSLLPNHAYLIPTGLTCSYRCPDRLMKFYLHANVRLSGHEDLFSRLSTCLELPWPVERMSEMARLAASTSLADTMLCKSMILKTTAAFLFLAGIHEEENFQVQSRYEGLFQLVAVNPAQANPLLLAKSLQCHPVQLQREFRRDMGMTLQQYIRASLLESVKIRLQTTGDPIRVIASDFGFPDEFYFSRLFRRRVGVSPRAYRQNNRMSF